LKRIVWKYGLISGAIVAALMSIGVPASLNGTISFEYGQLVGYSAMVLSFLLVFFGIRAYRDDVGAGKITFGRAFGVGILITLISCAIYVVAWEIVFFNFVPDFADKYATVSLENMRRKGASDAEIVKATADMAKFKELYKNPLFNIGMTFLEIFPVGLIVTLVSAAILRTRRERLATA
jgi:Protein of unknown function (DUF4199)